MTKVKSLDDLRELAENLPEEDVAGEAVTNDPQPEPEPEAEVSPETTENQPEVAEEGKPEEEEVLSADADSSSEESETEETTPETYEPKLIYKSMGEEHKMDDFIKEAIKSPEQEEIVKRLYEKAAGLEHLESKNKHLKEQLEGVEPDVQMGRELKQEIDFYNQLISQGKYHELFRSINIPDDEILKVAQTILQYKDLTPQQQSVYDNNIQSHHRLHQLELQHNQLQQQVNSSTHQNHINELDSVLGRPDVSQAVKMFDERVGESGAFKREVINRAAMLEQQTMNNPNGPTVLTPEQAVNQVLKMYGHVAENQTAQATSSDVAPNGQRQSQPVVPQKKPTLPNLKGGAKSPAKKVFKSLDDIRKLADTLEEY